MPDPAYKFEPVPIELVQAGAYTIPTDAHESDGTYEWDSTTLITVHVHAGGLTGLGYTYSDAAARWKRHRDEIQPKSADVRQTVSFAYQKGGASLLDLLSAQRTDNEVRLATAQAAAETARAAADLKAALNIGTR